MTGKPDIRTVAQAAEAIADLEARLDADVAARERNEVRVVRFGHRVVSAIAVFGLMVTLALAATGMLYSRSHDRDDKVARQGHDAIQQNVNARYDDCTSGDGLRSALRAQVREAKRTDPLLYRLLPSLDTPEVRALVRVSRARQLAAYAPRDCHAFALAAVPKGARGSYTVPSSPKP